MEKSSVASGSFNSVANGMTEVEQGSSSGGLPLVFLDDVSLDGDVAGD